MTSSSWVYAAAGYNLAFAVFHLGFWRLFRWKDELPKLHPVNRGVMQVLNLMLTFVLLGLAALQVLLPGDLAGTPLGRLLTAGATAFWVVRAGLQPVFWPKVAKGTNAAFISLFMLGAGLHALTFQP